MQIFNQQDYPKDYLGKTKYTIAKWGCLTVTLNMIYNYINGKNIEPPKVAQMFKYLNTGDLIWSSIDILGLKMIERVRTYRKDLIDKAYAIDGEYVALQVNSSHWVWVIGRYIPLLGYRVADPLHGDRCYVLSRYKKITGHAVIIKK